MCSVNVCTSHLAPYFQLFTIALLRANITSSCHIVLYIELFDVYVYIKHETLIEYLIL